MPRLSLPVTASAAAFAVTWWAAAMWSGHSPLLSTSADPAANAAGHPDSESPSKTLSCLDRREARLLATERPGVEAIRNLFLSGNQPLDSVTIYRLARIWAEQDPAGFWKWLSTGGESRLGDCDVSSIVLAAWFRRDPAAAMAAWREIPIGLRSYRAGMDILTFLMEPDSEERTRLLPYLDELVTMGAGLSWNAPPNAETAAVLSSLQPGAGRNELLGQLTMNWISKDWKAASAWIGALTEPLKSGIMERVAGLVLSIPTGPDGKPFQGNLSYQNPACVAWAQEWFGTAAPAELRQALGENYVTNLAATDPEAALDWAQQHLAALPLSKALGKIFAQEAVKDPIAARGLVEQLPPGAIRQRAAFSVVSEPTPESVDWLRQQADKGASRPWMELGTKWAEKSPAEFRQYVDAATSEALPPYLLASGLHSLARQDGPGTVDWALRTQPARNAELALRTWSWGDPPAAAGWLKDHIPTASAWPVNVFSDVANGFFRRDPAQALDWALSLPEIAGKATAVATIRQNLNSNRTLEPGLRQTLEAKMKRP
jgi:hypothetical protein